MNDDRSDAGTRSIQPEPAGDTIAALLELAANPALARRAIAGAEAHAALRAPFDAVAASSTDTLHPASLLAHARGIPMAYVRQQAKGYGLRRQIEGRVPPGASVLLLVEDARAEQARIAEGALREAGAGTIRLLPVGEIVPPAAGAASAAPGAGAPSAADAALRSDPGAIGRDVAAALLDIGAVALNLVEPYTYTSGLRSPIYTDNRLLMSHPAAWRVVLGGLAARLTARAKEFDLLVGMTTSGIPHASVLGQWLARPMVYLPGDGDPRHDRQVGAFAGQRALIIEDLVTTGGSVLKTAARLRELGLAIAGCLAIFTYRGRIVGENFAAAAIALETLTDLETLLDVAIARGQITPEEARLVLDWRDDPPGWFARFQAARASAGTPAG